MTNLCTYPASYQLLYCIINYQSIRSTLRATLLSTASEWNTQSMCLEPSHSQGNLSDKSSTPHTDLNFQSKYSARFTKLSSFLFNKENSLSDFYSAIRICFIKTVNSDQLGEIFSRLFGNSSSGRVGHVDIVQAKLLSVPVSFKNVCKNN